MLEDDISMDVRSSYCVMLVREFLAEVEEMGCSIGGGGVQGRGCCSLQDVCD